MPEAHETAHLVVDPFLANQRGTGARGWLAREP